MGNLRFKVERFDEFIEVELADGNEHASLLLAIDEWRSFSDALASAIADADDSDDSNER